MKKICLTLLLTVMTLSGCVVFSACNNGGYDLSNLFNDYTTMVNKYEYVVMDEHKFKFDYTKFKQGDNQYFVSALQSEPYSNLNSMYNNLLSNSLEFVNKYISSCSTKEYEVNKSLRNELKENLDKLEVALDKTHTHTKNVADVLRADTDLTGNVNMTRLSNLFDSYSELYTSIFNFSRVLSKIYSEYILQDYNPDYSTIPLTQFNANNAIADLDNRISTQIVNLTESFVVKQVVGSNLSRELTTKQEGSFVGVNMNDYNNSINELRVSYNQSIETTPEKREQLHNAFIRLYNVQANLDNNYEAYTTACNSVVYAEAIKDENITDFERTFLEIIDARQKLVEENSSALVDILNIITAA